MPRTPLHIISNSKYIYDCFSKKLTSWEEKGWIEIPNKEIIKPIVSHLRARGAITTFAKATNPMALENAITLAQHGPNKVSYDAVDLTPDPKFNLTGAQLSEMSQALIYKGIQQKAQLISRSSTVINLDITRHAVQKITGHQPTDATIWLSIRSKDITRLIRVFLWKVLHNTYKCGEYWLQIPGFEHRSKCPECGVEDSMTHILMECDAPGQKEVWVLAREIWKAKHLPWPRVNSLGVITGCGMSKFLSKTGKHKLGAERFYRILMTESAYLIWKIRCERVLERSNRDQWHSAQEIKNRWHDVMNKRLTLDQAMTNRRYETKAIAVKLVLGTWSGALQNESSLPENWINHSGVLVGIGPPEHPWWQRPKPP